MKPAASRFRTRALAVEDLHAFADLRLEGIRLFPGAFLLTEDEALAVPDAALLSLLSAGKTFGVFDRTRLVGFAGLEMRPWAMAAHRANVGPFYVTPTHQGQGAAQALAAHLDDLARARSVRQLELWVAEDNARARAFYARLGYRKSGRMPGAVLMQDGPRDDLFMVRDLTVAPPAPGPDGTRRLHPGDWRAFRKIRLEMLLDAPGAFGATHDEWAAKAPDEVMERLAAVHQWAVIDAGRIIATAGWHPFGGAVTGHRGHVIAVYTAPEARGRGLAVGLLDDLAREAREAGITQLELDVGVTNAAAIATYRAAGFAVTGNIPRSGQHGGVFQDQHIMVRDLRA